MKDFKRYEKDHDNTTAAILVTNIKKGKFVFDHTVQRSLVWTNEQKSLLIHSMIVNAPIPPMYAVRDTKTGVCSFIDGKQRSNAIAEFFDDSFCLESVPTIDFYDGTSLDINGKYFSELDEELRKFIEGYTFTIYKYNDMTDEEVADVFYRLNHGSTLKAIEQMRVKCPAIKEVQKVADHPIIRLNVGKSGKARYADEDLVLKSYAMLMMDEPCLDTKVIKGFASDLTLDKEQVKDMLHIYDKLNSVKDHMEIAKSAKKVVGRTHLCTLVPFVKNHEGDTVEKLASFLDKFYNGKGHATSISDLYNDCCKSGTGHKENVRDRLKELEKAYNG